MNAYVRFSMKGSLFLLIVGVFCGFRTELQISETPGAEHSVKMERIIVAPDNRGFITNETKRPFHPWGMNYGNAGRLIEDFWDKDWDTIDNDFREMKSLGANVVRIHLQFGKFMTAPNQANLRALKQLQRLLKLAEETRLYLDLTGLACYRPADIPAWYDAMDEPERWAAQARFWEAVAGASAHSPAVFCYDLINEPLSPAEKRKSGQWRSGNLFGGYDFLQYIALDPAGRKRESIPVQWIRKTKTAIRKYDQAAVITVGQLPWSSDWKHMSGFLPRTVAPELDFLSVHIYPDRKRPGEALECLRQFAVGKPVLIEETFPLSCSIGELETFLRASRSIACGWIGHYDGAPIDELDSLERVGKLTLPQAIYREWQRMFIRLKRELVQP
jgi:hypothetical protein